MYQVNQIIKAPGAAWLIELTGWLLQPVAVRDGSWLEGPAWPAQTLVDIEAAWHSDGGRHGIIINLSSIIVQLLVT